MCCECKALKVKYCIILQESVRLTNRSDQGSSVRVAVQVGVTPALCLVVSLLYVPVLACGHWLWVMPERIRLRVQVEEMQILCGVDGEPEQVDVVWPLYRSCIKSWLLLELHHGMSHWTETPEPVREIIPHIWLRDIL